MGRRKILIKPLKDERNRSVTFLKRKAGLFKKAHELSVLCSVDIAVIIFGNNKKLYEFTSCDTGKLIELYNDTTPHERKVPADFQKDYGVSDDELENENENEVYSDRGSTSPVHLHSQSGSSGSAAAKNVQTTSPFDPHTQQQQQQQQQQQPIQRATVSPPRSILRTQSRNHSRASSLSNIQSLDHNQLGQYEQQLHHQPNQPQHYQSSHHQSHQQLQQNLPDAQQYNFITFSQRPPQSHQQTHQANYEQYSQQQQQQKYNGTVNYNSKNSHHSQFLNARQATGQPQFIPYDQSSQAVPVQLPYRPNSSLEVKVDSHTTDSLKHDSSTILQPIQKAVVSDNASSSNQYQLPSLSVTTHYVDAESKNTDNVMTQSLPTLSAPTTRPKLKLRIPPDESTASASRPGSKGQASSGSSNPTTTSSPSQENSAAPPISAHVKELSSPAVLLPPPSPSTYMNANSLGGPGNPFARPATSSSQSYQAPVNSNVSSNNGNGREQTPISALPSRYVSDLLPSPSVFYSADWGSQFGSKNSGLGQDLLPSPLQFHTPVVVSAANTFNRDKTNNAEESNGLKRVNLVENDDKESQPEEKKRRVEKRAAPLA
ncbi:hypothetical protein V1514DRAFT_306003 [Lipomyces japonicus]|uniref:uncharacterized protein n=1 Tax=Lipomyces japonicus TaxID=56871 RepID=UPI0034CF5B0E